MSMTAASHVCSSCSEHKPSTEDYFVRDRRTAYGFLPGCIVCRMDRKREQARRYARKYAPGYRAANEERLRERDRDYMRRYRMAKRA